jgi:hypothetical protein
MSNNNDLKVIKRGLTVDLIHEVKIEYQLINHKNKKIILFDESNTYQNIINIMKKKYPNVDIEIVNQLRG